MSDAFGSIPGERKAVFIDGANVYATMKSLGFDIDYKELHKELWRTGSMVQPHYYTAVIEDQEYSSIRPLLDWLDYNGYKVKTKPSKVFHGSDGSRKIKGNCDVELTVDMLTLAQSGRVDHMILFSGDGDFTALVEAVQRLGVRVSVVSTIKTQPAMIADDLRRQADNFIDLKGLANLIGKEPRRDAPRRDRYDHDDEGSSPMPAFLQREPVDRGYADRDATESRYSGEAQEQEHEPEAAVAPEPEAAVITKLPRAPAGRGRASRTIAGLPGNLRGTSRT